MALLRKAPAPALSLERTALAAAIERHAAYLAERDAANRAEGPAEDAVTAAHRAVEAAQQAVERAPADAGRYLIAKAQGTAGEAPRTIRQARDALTDAEDALEAAIAARDAVKAEAARLATSWTDTVVTRAAKAVLQAEGHDAARAVAAEVIRLQHDLVRAGQTLAFLVEAQVFPVVGAIGSNYGKPADEEIRDALFRLQYSPPLTWHELTDRTDGAAVWRAAVAALEADATAPLPGGA